MSSFCFEFSYFRVLLVSSDSLAYNCSPPVRITQNWLHPVNVWEINLSCHANYLICNLKKIVLTTNIFNENLLRIIFFIKLPKWIERIVYTTGDGLPAERQ